ncbi:MAG: Maf family nucleotide pyrophosphatase [Aurantimicrobium sp.]|nr:Maf family nucleotide pyrophosphatase [Aurantimicrobium sp.]
MRLYLASTSPARLATLRAAGIEPIVVPSGVDEDAAVREAEAVSGPLPAAEMVLLLARAKAEAALAQALAAGTPLDGLVLGGDSAFVLDGVIYGKPHTAERARERWHAQRGLTGELYSGHWLIDATNADAPRGVGATTVARVTFASDITDLEIVAYVASGEPLAVAGAFTVGARGQAFIERIEGDPSTVVGVSIPAVRRLAAQLGVNWPRLWSPTTTA